MKFRKLGLAAGLALACSVLAPLATASINGPGEGYYYIAYSTTGGYPPGTHFMSVGPFADQNSCMQARNADYGNGDAWLPYDGTGIHCTWIFHNEVGALEDALDNWNTVAGGGGGGNSHPGYLDVAKLERIAELREIYQLKRYEAEVAEVLNPRR